MFETIPKKIRGSLRHLEMLWAAKTYSTPGGDTFWNEILYLKFASPNCIFLKTDKVATKNKICQSINNFTQRFSWQRQVSRLYSPIIVLNLKYYIILKSCAEILVFQKYQNGHLSQLLNFHSLFNQL